MVANGYNTKRKARNEAIAVCCYRQSWLEVCDNGSVVDRNDNKGRWSHVISGHVRWSDCGDLDGLSVNCNGSVRKGRFVMKERYLVSIPVTGWIRCGLPARNEHEAIQRAHTIAWDADGFEVESLPEGVDLFKLCIERADADNLCEEHEEEYVVHMPVAGYIRILVPANNEDDAIQRAKTLEWDVDRFEQKDLPGDVDFFELCIEPTDTEFLCNDGGYDIVL